MKHDEAMYTFGIGENFHLQNYLGSHEIDGSEEGYVFRVWAPHAENVQVIGDFTGWFDEPLDMVKKSYWCLGGNVRPPRRRSAL